jgi:hypothetical protein
MFRATLFALSSKRCLRCETGWLRNPEALRIVSMPE